MTTKVVDALTLVIEATQENIHLPEAPRISSLDDLARLTATSLLKDGLLTIPEAILVRARIDNAKNTLVIGTP